MTEPNPICKSCHVEVRPTDYFCFNCGKNLRPAPPSTSFGSQFSLYLKSALLPPLGIIWGFRYIRYPSTSSRVVGIVAIIITVASLYYFTKITVDTINQVNTQINSQLQQLNMY